MSPSIPQAHLTESDRRAVARARELLNESHGHDLYDLAKRIGALEWWLGDILGLVARLTGEDQADDQADDDLEPYCATCGSPAGHFIGIEGWRHFRGEGTVADPVVLVDAGHAPEVAWRVAGGAR
jgi:hypothetical protein